MISEAPIHTVAQKLLDILNEADPDDPSVTLSKPQHDAARALLCHSPAHVKLWAILARDIAQQKPDLPTLEAVIFRLGIANCVGVPSPDLIVLRARAAQGLAEDDIALSLGLEQIKIDPLDPRAYTVLALCLCERGDLQAGLIYGRKSVLLDPSDGEALNGLLFAGRAGPDDLLWRWISFLDGDSVSIGFHRAACLLEHEHWQEGWQAHRVRMRQNNYSNIWRHSRAPEWQGEKTGRLLLCPEEGMGDQLRSLGYLGSLRDRAEEISLVLHPRLHSFVKQGLPWLDVLSHDEAAARDFDAQLMLEDAGCYAAHIRRPLFADRHRPVPRKRRRIGIAWFGGADRRLSLRRSIDPDDLITRLSQASLELVSLQHKVPPQDQDRLERMGLVFDPHINPLGDADAYAEAIAGLDGVISVTNTIVHLAGILGVPTYCLAPYYAQWYWAVGADGRLTYPSYWYPSVQIFRQSVAGEWQDPLSRLIMAVSNVKPVED